MRAGAVGAFPPRSVRAFKRKPFTTWMRRYSESAESKYLRLIRNISKMLPFLRLRPLSRPWMRWCPLMAEFRMPSLGADMQEGTLIEWSVKPGDRVKRGDIIGVVRTEKADIEVEVYHDGVVDQLLAKAGETLPVGAVLAVIREEGKAEVATAPVREAIQPAGAIPVSKPPAVRLRASPLARRVAQELGIDLSHVQGTGPQAEITNEDVQRAAEALKQAPIEKPAAPDFRAGMRRAIAAAMARSNREIPHYY